MTFVEFQLDPKGTDVRYEITGSEAAHAAFFFRDFMKAKGAWGKSPLSTDLVIECVRELGLDWHKCIQRHPSYGERIPLAEMIKELEAAQYEDFNVYYWDI